MDVTHLLQQTAVEHDVAAEQLGQPDAAQPSLAQQASAFRDAAQQDMAESVESPEASGADPYPYNAPSYLIPHTEDTRPSSFVSPKKQKTGTGHAVSLHAPSGLLCPIMHRRHTWLPLSLGLKSLVLQTKIEPSSCTSTFTTHMYQRCITFRALQ